MTTPGTVSIQCPHHPVIALIMACPRCARLFFEHVARIARLPKVGR